jgi:predicted amidohydrolase YtcJ
MRQDPESRNGFTRRSLLNDSLASVNGWFLREEHDLGTIEVGKLADLVVLNDDYFTVDDVRTISSVLTVVGGIGVHEEGVMG